MNREPFPPWGFAVFSWLGLDDFALVLLAVAVRGDAVAGAELFVKMAEVGDAAIAGDFGQCVFCSCKPAGGVGHADVIDEF